ncbi:MAG: hypothetical protein WD995_03315 [Gemmatimonadota bacterium]
MRLVWAACFGVVTAFAACGGEAQEPASDLVSSSDPELRRLAAEILPDLALRAGLELLAPVRLERRSRSELEGYLRFKLDEEFPRDEAEATVRAYSMLGLVGDDLDLRGLLLELYTEQVAGFYEPDSTALFVMDDQPRDALEGLLLHELVHAVQDQTVDLDAMTSSALGNDRAAAAHAAIEGHATLVMLEFMMERMTGQPVDLAEVPELADQLLPALDDMSAQFPALAGAPEIVRRSLLFPYVHGAGFVQELWAREGRVPPFGRHLPTSTEQVMEGDFSDTPVVVELTVRGGRIVHEDVLGRLEVEVLVETHLGQEARSLGEGWGGDRFVLVSPDGGGPEVLAWVSVWDDEASRDAFSSGFQPVLADLGGSAALESIEPGGRPGLLLTVGEVGALAFEPSLGDGG